MLLAFRKGCNVFKAHWVSTLKNVCERTGVRSLLEFARVNIGISELITMFLNETLDICSTQFPKTIEAVRLLASDKVKEGNYDPSAGLTQEKPLRRS